MKVLVGVDGSPNSLAALEFVVQLLSPERDQILAVFAATLIAFDEVELVAGVAARAQTAMSKAVFDQVEARLPAEWRPRTELVEVVGPPSSSLLETIKERGADMAVVGFRGLGIFERVMLGSVCRAVAYSAAVPVLVVKSEPTGEGHAEHESSGPLRALAAYDLSPAGARIAAVLHRCTWPDDAECWAATVVEPMLAGETPDWLPQIKRDPDVQAMAEAWQKEHEQQVAQSRQEITQFQQKLPRPFTQNEPLVVEGHPAEKLIETIKQLDINLAIVGHRGAGAIARMFLGSTSDSVLTYAPCSVLIAR